MLLVLLRSRSQYARPVSDVSGTNWQASSGTDLFAMVDEPGPSDDDSVWTATPNAVVEFALVTVADPTVHTEHIIRYRAKRSAGTAVGSCKVGVYQNTTLIEEWTDTLAESMATFSHTIAEANAANITNYGQLRVRLTALAS